jgi:hypothetical protein
MQGKNKTYFIIVVTMIVIAASTRFLPHPPNVTAMGAMGLFGAAYFTKKQWAFIVPFVAFFLSDLILNNVVYAQYYEGFVWMAPGAYWTYIGFAGIVLLGMGWLKKVKPLRLLGASISASLVFYLVSNFGVWASGTMYPLTGTGLMASYAAGLPFLPNTLVGDLLYSGILFGIYEFVVLRQGRKLRSSEALDA